MLFKCTKWQNNLNIHTEDQGLVLSLILNSPKTKWAFKACRFAFVSVVTLYIYLVLQPDKTQPCKANDALTCGANIYFCLFMAAGGQSCMSLLFFLSALFFTRFFLSVFRVRGMTIPGRPLSVEDCIRALFLALHPAESLGPYWKSIWRREQRKRASSFRNPQSTHIHCSPQPPKSGIPLAGQPVSLDMGVRLAWCPAY